MNRLPFKTIIFSRVPCKIFGIMPYEILEDILIGLADNNERVLENLSVHSGCFKQPKVIELMFLLADHWCQDSTTKYQAVELLDRFMILYVQQLYKSSTDNRNVMEITEAWASAKASLCEKFILYLVSCIQITSKLNFHDHIFNSNVVIQLLRAAGYSYKKEDLLKSEMTVLKTLDFYINIQSPFTFVEMLLEVLGYNGCSLPLKHVHDMCVMVLDLVYLLRNPIYHTLLKSTVDLSTPSSTQRSKFLAVKEDLMLLGTGVIAASTFIINQNSWKQVLEHLSNITGITENSIFEICSAILKHSTEFDVLTQHRRAQEIADRSQHNKDCGEMRRTDTLQVDCFRERITNEAEDLVASFFPNKLLELDGFLKEPMLNVQDLTQIHSEMNLPVPDPILLTNSHDGLDGPNLKKRKLEDDDHCPGTKVFVMPNGMLKSNAPLVEIIEKVKPEIRLLIEKCNTVKMWVQLLIPRIEDGNNFGVSIQEETVAELRTVESEAASYLDQISRYYITRAKLVSKIAKYPHVEDYRRTVTEIDEKEYISLRLIISELRNQYVTLHDMIFKNIEKIKRPRNSNAETLY